MKRRAVLGATVGLAAAAGGLGLALRRERRDLAAAELWALRLPTPDGQELVLAQWRGRPFVLNFWATWCAPCVREMPQLDRFAREFGPRGWTVIGLAVDQPAPVRQFLQRVPVQFPIGIAGFAGIDLSRALGNERGLLPFTVVVDAEGRIARAKLGETHFEELAGWAADL